MNNRKLPIGIQSFEKIREGNYLYIDKTQYIWDLASGGSTYFLSRPRRFGKSMLISTLEAYFLGKKELFKGLAIEKYENAKGEDAWQKYPVITFSLASGNYTDADGLKQRLSNILSEYEKRYHLNTEGIDLPNRFVNLIRRMHEAEGRNVVVLVDEYDKPLLDNIEINREQEAANRRLYSSFFNVLKDEDAYIKFSFITGVTKFAKVSIFSGVNQPNDISMDDDFSAVCGITEEELKKTFRPEITAMALKNEETEQECLANLARMYDGYLFAKRGIKVYNPFSVLNAFYKKDYGRYWFSTGTPTFLVRMLENSGCYPEQIADGVLSTEDNMRDYRGEETDPIPLAYQAGYLTIKRYDRENGVYILGFPNEEVEYGYLNVLAPSVLGGRETQRTMSLTGMTIDLRKGDLSSFMKRLETLFASMPYIEGKAPEYEQVWQREIYLILKMIGQRVYCQVHTALGRADCIIETVKYVYIFEFKVDNSAEEAIEQINEKGYAVPYQADPRKIYKVGVNFSSSKRNIDSWKAEETNQDIRNQRNNT